MQTNELTGFAKVLAEWTQQMTRLNAMAMDGIGATVLPDEVVIVLAEMEHTTEVFERLMGVDDPIPPEAGRVLFCAAPQLGTVIGRTIGNGDARYDVRLASGVVITVPADFIGGEASAMLGWAEQRGKAIDNEIKRHLTSPDGKR